MSNIVETLSRASTNRRWIPICVMAVVTLGAVLGYVAPDLPSKLWNREDTSENSVVAKQFESPPDNVQPLSLSRSDCVMLVEGEEFFNFESTETLRAIVEALEELPQVQSIVWLDRVPILNIFGLPQPLLPNSHASETRYEAAKQRALEHPLVYGQLLSDDGKAMLLLINLNVYEVLSDYEATGLLTDTAKRIATERGSDMSFRLTGNTPTAIAAIGRHEANQLRYQIIGYGMILIMSFILFRGWRAVVIVALAPLLGVFWTLGYVRFLGYDNNPLVDVILPILVSLVGLTDGVHLMVQIRKLRSQGAAPRTAAAQGLASVGTACLLTSITTAIGFGSLLLADSEWVQEFGLSSTIGVLLCFVSVVTVIPLACGTWLGVNVHVGLEKSLIDKNLGKIDRVIDWVLHRRRALCAIAILCTVGFGAFALTLTPDQRQSDGLPQDAEATIAMQEVDRRFGGLEFANVEIRWKESIKSTDPQVLLAVTAADELLRREPLIGHPLSIKNLIDAQPGSGPASERMTLLELLPPPLKRAFYTPELRRANVSFRVQDLGIAAYGPVFERIEAGFTSLEAEFPDFNFELDGGAVWRWRNLYQIVVDLAASLGTASVIILIVLALCYRSLRLGLISIVPNLFPLTVTAVYLKLAGYNLEIVMVCNFTICLGIAVDDTIHFLTRYREELQSGKDSDEAIRTAFTSVGTALIMTTTVLVAGFSVVTFSDSRDHFIFAIMGAITISSALFCDLLFLPALLSVFGRAKRSQNQVLQPDRVKT